MFDSDVLRQINSTADELHAFWRAGNREMSGVERAAREERALALNARLSELWEARRRELGAWCVAAVMEGK